MKSLKILALFGLLLASSDALATIVCANQLISPDGKIIRLLGDLHAARPNEHDQKQRNDLLQQMSSHSDCLLLAEDIMENPSTTQEWLSEFGEVIEHFRARGHNMILPGLVSEAKEKGICAINTETRHNNNDVPWDKEHFKAFVENFQKQSHAVFPHIPMPLKQEFENLYNDFEHHILNYCRNVDELWKARSFYLEIALFDFVTIAHINQNATENNIIYVCAGSGHIENLNTALQKLGYINTGKTPEYCDTNTKQFSPVSNSLDIKETLKTFDCDMLHTPSSTSGGIQMKSFKNLAIALLSLLLCSPAFGAYQGFKKVHEPYSKG